MLDIGHQKGDRWLDNIKSPFKPRQVSVATDRLPVDVSPPPHVHIDNRLDSTPYWGRQRTIGLYGLGGGCVRGSLEGCWSKTLEVGMIKTHYIHV